MVGFSWGGSAAFAYAVDRPELDALVVFHGETPEAESDYARIDAPGLGLHGGDLRTAATLPRAAAVMAAAGKSFETIVYDGATVFLKAQEGLDANRRATEDAWHAAAGRVTAEVPSRARALRTWALRRKPSCGRRGSRVMLTLPE